VLVFRRSSLCYNVFRSVCSSSILCLVSGDFDFRSNRIFQTRWRPNCSMWRHDSWTFRDAARVRVSIHFKTRQGKYFFTYCVYMLIMLRKLRRRKCGRTGRLKWH
jgi:hypothetical protein